MQSILTGTLSPYARNEKRETYARNEKRNMKNGNFVSICKKYYREPCLSITDCRSYLAFIRVFK